jgi:acetyl esterase/lipase
MRWSYMYLLLTASCSLGSGEVGLYSAATGSQYRNNASHVVHRNIPYGADARQIMDIHLGRDAERLMNRNYTIVFLHGGDFSFGDNSDSGSYVKPFLRKGMNVVEMSYRTREGFPAAAEDLTNALNHLTRQNDRYNLDLFNVIVAGVSSGGTIATTTGLSQHDPEYPYPLEEGIRITGILNFSGPVDQLQAIEEILRGSDDPSWRIVGDNMFPPNGRFGSEEMIERFTPFTYLEEGAPPIFLSYGGLGDQIPSSTFARFAEALRNSSTNHRIVFYPETGQSLRRQELHDTFDEVFQFLDGIPLLRIPFAVPRPPR